MPGFGGQFEDRCLGLRDGQLGDFGIPALRRVVGLGGEGYVHTFDEWATALCQREIGDRERLSVSHGQSSIAGEDGKCPPQVLSREFKLPQKGL
jgi:hypothetical protein